MATLVKTTLHSTIAESVFREIGTRGSKFFFFLGKPTGWTTPPNPTDNFASELDTRNESILFQEIKPSDACLVVRRIDWEEGQVYDKYDDNLFTGVAGINLKTGGYGYKSIPNVVITGNGTGATAVASIDDEGRIVDVTMTNSGSGYSGVVSVAFTGALIEESGSQATAEGVLNVTASGKTKLEDADFYVLTEDYNVYKCLNNNYNAESTVKPTGTSEKPIKTSDGYVWRFMYNIPVTLRNKFLTSEYMPVINTLNDNFYDNGEIRNINIASGGKDYTWAKIVVNGDGYVENNSRVVNIIAITASGEDYESPELIVQPPFTADVDWQQNYGVLEGEIVAHNDKFYRVVVSGNLASGSNGYPVHRDGVEKNGTALLKYIGETAKGELAVTNGNITSANLFSRVYSIEIESGGSGYTSTPTITIFPSNGGSGATATAETLNGTVTKVNVVTRGDNYKSEPYVFVGEFWVQNATYSVGKQIFHQDNLYTVTQAGTSGTNAPTHTSVAQATNGTAIFTYVGKAAKARARMLSGFGYSFNPSCEISDVNGLNGNVIVLSEKTSARLNPIVNNGSIIGVTIEESGIGYTYANLNVIGDGTGAILKTDFFVGDVNSVQGNSQLLGVDGSIHHVELISGGYDYDQVLPAVTIDGDGAGATAICVLNPAQGGDKILKVEVQNPGQGYRWANVRLTGGSGKGAKARAVISPYLGHGKDAIAELFASKLMFYIVMSGETLFGFDIENEYRQVGIIKNPRKFSDKSFLGGGSHTPCVIVSGNFDSTKFFDDMEVKIRASDTMLEKKFRIVSMTENTMLLQMINNYIPELGEELENGLTGGSFYKFSIESVVSPTVDKYSGDLLYIENRTPFKPTKTESIALRSILTF